MPEPIENKEITDRVLVWITSSEATTQMSVAYDNSDRLVAHLQEEREIDLEDLNEPFDL